MKKYLAMMALMCLSGLSMAQEPKFARQALEADLDYLQQQLRDVHADPLRELNAQQWQQRFAGIRSQLKDSMTAAAFFAVVKPAIAYLSDEHADLASPAYFTAQAVFPPFALRAAGDAFLIDTVWNTSALHKDDRVAALNGVPVRELIAALSSYTTGFPDERLEKTPAQFGYLYGLAHPYSNTWEVTLADGRHVSFQPSTIKPWAEHLKNLYGAPSGKSFGYRAYGKTGYIVVPDFGVRGPNGMSDWERKVDSVFQLVARDGVTKLVIDISQNSGGNSAVGRLFINRFYNKPYRSYQMGWRRSNEYLATLKSYGASDADYEGMKPGETLRRGGGTETPPSDVPKFKGKVYVLVGNGTFSSAMMFATLIKDNSMATLVGQTPKSGHPSHFGELYSTRLPNTQLALRFGVKEWIRPAGNAGENKLRPDILVDPADLNAVLKAVGENAR